MVDLAISTLSQIISQVLLQRKSNPVTIENKLLIVLFEATLPSIILPTPTTVAMILLVQMGDSITVLEGVILTVSNPLRTQLCIFHSDY